MKKLLTGLLLLCIATAFAGSPVIYTGGVFKRYPPGYDTTSKRSFLRNEQAPFGRKVLLGSGEVLGYNMLVTTLLFVLPRQISNWRNITAADVRQQYHRSFTSPPAVDGDVWYINYVGHPYQGACYYNALRSQGAKFWQAGLFSLGHSLIWEYVAEGGLEQPSIQDLIVTPIGGSLLGELIHFGTVRMSRNGFTWYEKAFVCLFNPMFAINNGFKYAGVPPRRYR